MRPPTLPRLQEVQFILGDVGWRMMNDEWWWRSGIDIERSYDDKIPHDKKISDAHYVGIVTRRDVVHNIETDLLRYMHLTSLFSCQLHAIPRDETAESVGSLGWAYRWWNVSDWVTNDISWGEFECHDIKTRLRPYQESPQVSIFTKLSVKCVVP